MNDAQLAQRMADQNPWWRRVDWEQDDPALRAVAGASLDYEPGPLTDVKNPGLYVLRGPRRVGKSVEIKRAISRLVRRVPPRSVFYCSCEGMSPLDLHRLVLGSHSRARTIAGPRHWFLDEVSSIDGWSEVVKHLRDNDSQFADALVVLAGSSAWNLRDAVSDLAGRRGNAADSDRLLLPMSFRSFCTVLPGVGDLPDVSLRADDLQTPAGEAAIHEILPFQFTLDDAWQIYLEIGGYPQAVAEYLAGGSVSRGFVEALLDVVKGDVLRNSSLSETETLTLLDRLAGNLCSPVNLSAVARDVGLEDNHRVKDRITGLVSNFLGWQCYQARKGIPHPNAQRKFYFMDPLLIQLPRLRNGSFPIVDLSRRNEQQIGLALNRSLTAASPIDFIESSQTMYERTPSGDREIDFVGPRLVSPVECKYVDHGWKREAQTMQAAYGKGIMATRGIMDLEGAIWAVPAAMVAWLLG